jgi:hypothetical protein
MFQLILNEVLSQDFGRGVVPPFNDGLGGNGGGIPVGPTFPDIPNPDRGNDVSIG